MREEHVIDEKTKFRFNDIQPGVAIFFYRMNMSDAENRKICELDSEYPLSVLHELPIFSVVSIKHRLQRSIRKFA
jgi:hypothetical protein